MICTCLRNERLAIWFFVLSGRFLGTGVFF